MQRFSIPGRTAPAGLALSCLVAAGCSGAANQPSDRNAAKYAAGGTFTMVLHDDRGNFDPYQTNILNYAKFAYDSLVNLQPNGKFATGLAAKWSVGVKSATFTLRAGVTCSDGAPLTASQVAADLTYLGDPKNKSVLYGVTIPAVPYTVTANDAARTVKVTLSKPFGFLLQTIGQTPVVCPKGLKDPNRLKFASDGTGPFVLTEVVPGQSYTFMVRKGYTWGPNGASTSAPGTPAKVVFKVLRNETTAANLLLSGEVNMARITGEDRARLDARGLAKFQRPTPGAWMQFNQFAERPAADRRIRQALVQAVDLGEVVKVNSGGTGKPATGLINLVPNVCADDTVSGTLPKYDAAAAEALLDQAGWTKGDDGLRRKAGRPLELDLLYVPEWSIYNKPTVELVAKRFEHIGIKAEIVATTLAELPKYLYQSRNWDIFLEGNGLNLPINAVPFYSGPVPPKGLNFSGVNNSAYNALVAKAKALPIPEACTFWKEAEQTLFRNIDVVPIVNRPEQWFMHKAEATFAGYDRPLPISIKLHE